MEPVTAKALLEDPTLMDTATGGARTMAYGEERMDCHGC